MRAVRWILAGLLLVLATQVALAQFSTTTAGGPIKTTVTSMPSFFQQTMTRPNLMPAVQKPNFPTPLRLPSLTPTLPNFQNVLLMRNIFASPQTQVVPPPKKK